MTFKIINKLNYILTIYNFHFINESELNEIINIFDNCKENIIIYINCKNSNAKRFIIKNTKVSSLFIKISKVSLVFNKKHINRLLIYNEKSLNPKYTSYKEIPRKIFKKYKKKIKFNNNLSYNKNGYILIYLNHLKGWFKKKIKLNNLNLLINNIREYSDKLIKIRPHPQDRYRDFNIKYKNVIIDYSDTWEEIIKNCYCIFIQNSGILFELLSYGIPLFNLDIIIKINYYPDCYIPINYINKIDQYKFNRKKLLKKYYSTIICYNYNESHAKFYNLIKNFLNKKI